MRAWQRLAVAHAQRAPHCIPGLRPLQHHILCPGLLQPNSRLQPWFPAAKAVLHGQLHVRGGVMSTRVPWGSWALASLRCCRGQRLLLRLYLRTSQRIRTTPSRTLRRARRTLQRARGIIVQQVLTCERGSNRYANSRTQQGRSSMVCTV